MPRRSSKVHLGASYQLLASYLVWDLKDLLAGGEEAEAARRRVTQLIEILDSAVRAGEPAYPAAPDERRAGAARGKRSERLASLDSDQQLLELVAVAHAGPLAATSEWAGRASSVLTSLEARDWREPSPADSEFVEAELQPFLRRLQRIDQIDSRGPGSRSGLARH
jgi:hypothetical protein